MAKSGQPRLPARRPLNKAQQLALIAGGNSGTVMAMLEGPVRTEVPVPRRDLKHGTPSIVVPLLFDWLEYELEQISGGVHYYVHKGKLHSDSVERSDPCPTPPPPAATTRPSVA